MIVNLLNNGARVDVTDEVGGLQPHTNTFAYLLLNVIFMIGMANSTAPCLFEGQYSSHQGASKEGQLSQSCQFRRQGSLSIS